MRQRKKHILAKTVKRVYIYCCDISWRGIHVKYEILSVIFISLTFSKHNSWAQEECINKHIYNSVLISKMKQSGPGASLTDRLDGAASLSFEKTSEEENILGNGKGLVSILCGSLCFLFPTNYLLQYFLQATYVADKYIYQDLLLENK